MTPGQEPARFRVAGLWRYPVKSLGGEPVEAASVGVHGIPGDRAFGIVDVPTGKVLTARREPRLLFASASWYDGEVGILADGLRLDGDAALSDWLGRPVRLARAGTEGGVYENPADFERETDWTSWQGPGHAWHDSSRTRVSLVSIASLGPWEPERFRANVVLEGADDEDDLVGAQVVLGTATLDVTKRIDRCVMVTRAQPGVGRDLDVLRAIHRDRGGCLAIGALIAEPGEVAVGDRLQVLPGRSGGIRRPGR